MTVSPRNLANPERFANFGLVEAGDARLAAWMLEHLRLAVWPSPAGVVLDEIETAVLAHLMPPLNLDKVATPWRAFGPVRTQAPGRPGPSMDDGPPPKIESSFHS